MIVRRRWVLVALLVLVSVLGSSCDSGEETPGVLDPTQRVPPKMTAPSGTPTAAPVGAKVALEYVKRLEGATLARVNGEEIAWEDYEPTLRQTLLSLDRQYELQWGDPAMQERLRHLQQEVLDQLVDRWLAGQMAAALGIEVGDAEVDAAIEEEKSKVLESGGTVTWEAFLETNGFTEGAFRRFIRDRMVFDALLAEQDVEADAEQVRISYIPVSDEATAQAIQSELKAGRNFGELVSLYSEDPETKDKGGDLGWFPVDRLPPQIEDVVLSLSPGEFSDVITTQTGYMVLQVVAREVREVESDQVRQEQLAALLSQLQAERSRAEIEVLVDFTAN
jgi:parvulin-like peptidyl-prolyl isomerase